MVLMTMTSNIIMAQTPGKRIVKHYNRNQNKTRSSSITQQKQKESTTQYSAPSSNSNTDTSTSGNYQSNTSVSENKNRTINQTVEENQEKYDRVKRQLKQIIQFPDEISRGLRLYNVLTRRGYDFWVNYGEINVMCRFSCKKKSKALYSALKENNIDFVKREIIGILKLKFPNFIPYLKQNDVGLVCVVHSENAKYHTGDIKIDLTE